MKVNTINLVFNMFLLKPLISCKHGRSKWHNQRETQKIEHKLTAPNCSWSEQRRGKKWIAGFLKNLKEKIILWIYIPRSHGECEVRRMNPKLDQRQASLKVGRKNLNGQRPGSNSLIGTLLLLIHKSGVY